MFQNFRILTNMLSSNFEKLANVSPSLALDRIAISHYSSDLQTTDLKMTTGHMPE